MYNPYQQLHILFFYFDIDLNEKLLYTLYLNIYLMYNYTISTEIYNISAYLFMSMIT